MKLNVGSCYALAWRSFRKWWIPLCLVSGIIVAVEIVPRILVRADITELMATARRCTTAVAGNDLAELEEIALRVRSQTVALARKLTLVALYSFPFVALLTVVLLMYANRAVKDKRGTRRSPGALAYIAFVHVMLALGKGVAFMLFFFPGVYVYIKLLFVSLIMLEQKRNAGAAIRISWRMTRGNFWELFLLVLMNTVIQFLALPTIVGAIPATGFANTARAAAFRMIWEEGKYAEA